MKYIKAKLHDTSCVDGLSRRLDDQLRWDAKKVLLFGGKRAESSHCTIDLSFAVMPILAHATLMEQ